jgi:hypothetical protein
MNQFHKALSSLRLRRAVGWLWLGVALHLVVGCLFDAAAADDASMSKQAVVSGVIVTATSRPLRGVAVGVVCTQSVRDYAERHPGLVLSARTDASGRYELHVPQRITEVIVVAHAKGFAPARSTVTNLRSERVAIAPLALRAGIQIAGHVVGTLREPISGATVMSAPEAQAGDTAHLCSHPQTITNASGDFTLDGLEPGMHSVSVAKEGFAVKEVDGINLDESHPMRRLTLELSSATFLTGRVVDSDGSPIRAAVLMGQPRPHIKIQAISDATGEFRLGPFERGARVYLTSSAVGFGTTQTDDVISPMKSMVVRLSRNGSLRGQAVDEETRKVLTAFRVSFHPRGGWAATGSPGTRSFQSPAGRFEWTDVGSGKWDISIEAEGYQPLQLSGVYIPPGGKSEDLILALKKGYEMRGRIIDAATGLGVRSASISYVAKSGSGAQELNPPPPKSTSTDSEGVFVLKNLPAGPLVLSIMADNYVRESREVSADAESVVEVALTAGLAITGRLLSYDGALGVAGTVTLWKLDSDSALVRSSDADGRFSFSALKPGKYRVSAESADGPASPRDVTVKANQSVTGLDLRLDRGGTIRGTVAGLLAGERGRVQIEVHASSFRADTRVDDEGNFTLKGVPAGKMEVSATTMLDRSISKTIELDTYEDVAVNFEFPSGYRLFGTVRRGGAPVPFIDVKVAPLEGQNVAAAGETSRSGQYVIDGIPAGKYSLMVEGGRTTLIEIRGERQLDLNLPENTVAGVAIDEQTGDPLSDVIVEVRATAGNTSEVRLEVRTDYAGHYSLVGLDAGAYWLSAYKPGYDLAGQQIQVAASLADMTIRMVPTDGVALTVRDAVTRSPLRHVWVIEKVDQGGGNMLAMMLDSLGVARLPPALKGRTFVVSSLGYRVAEVVHWNGAALDLSLVPDGG